MIMMAGIGKHGIRSLATQSVCFAGTSCKAIGPSVAIACALDLSRDPVSVDTSLLTPVPITALRVMYELGAIAGEHRN